MIKKDVVIIGAGVTGASIARELSKRELDVIVLEKASDVCEGTSKANSGIVHAGYDAKPGTLKAKLNVEGSKLMPELAKKLDFPFRQNGSLVLCFNEEDRPELQKLYEKAIANNVEDVRILSPDEVHSIEPNITDAIVGALYAPTGGIVCPFNLTIALAENAYTNGVEFSLDTEVTDIVYTTKNQDDIECDGYKIIASVHPSIANGLLQDEEIEYFAPVVINAAGVYAAKIHNMVSSDKINIIPRKGEYCLLDKKVGGYVSSTVFQLPTSKGKGVLVTPTVHGNLLIGPTASDETDFDMVDTTDVGLSTVLSVGALSVKDLPAKGNIITSFAGLRAHEENGDFIIGEPSNAPGFVDVAGIESPGLSCAPAIGAYVAGIVDRILHPTQKDEFIDTRKGIVSMASATPDERAGMIEKDSSFANVVCRCELVTEGEIIDAINRPLGATTLDGIKRRTRAGMGRCQAGFCTPRQAAILARELKVDVEQISKKGNGSELLMGYPKEDYIKPTKKGGEADE